MKFSTWLKLMQASGIFLAVAVLLCWMAHLSGELYWIARANFVLLTIGMLGLNNYFSLMGVTEHDA